MDKVIEEAYSEALLWRAVIDDHMNELNAIPSKDELAALYTFSIRHEARMRRLLRRAKRKPGLTSQIFKRAAVAVLLLSTIMFCSALSAEAVREVIWATLSGNSERYLHKDREDPKETPFYQAAYLPDGFTELWREEIMGGCTIMYKNSEQTELAFFQYPRDSDVRHSIQGVREYSQYDMNGVTVHIYKAPVPGDKNLLQWNNGETKFALSSTLDTDVLLKIAESVKVISGLNK